MYTHKRVYRGRNKTRKKKQDKKISILQKGSGYKIDEETMRLMFPTSYAFDIAEIRYTVEGKYKGIGKVKPESFTYDAYKTEIKTKIQAWNSLQSTPLISYISMHGKYFKGDVYNQTVIKYIKIPENIMVCILTPPDSYSVALRPKKQSLFQTTNLFQNILAYRCHMKKEELKFRRYESFQLDAYDLFKFSSWYYPGQVCHNYRMNLSTSEIKTIEKESYDIENNGQTFHRTMINKLKEIFTSRSGLFCSLMDIIQLVPSNRKCVLLLEGCNMTHMEMDEKIHQSIWSSHHINKQITEDIEKELETGIPPADETNKYTNHHLRSSFQHLYRHTVVKGVDSKTDPSLKINDKLFYIHSRNFNRNYKIDLIYEIFEKIDNSSYDEISDMTEYVLAVQYFTPVDMFVFTSHARFAVKDKDKYHYFLNFVFDRGNYLFHSMNYILRYLQVSEVLKDDKTVRYVEYVGRKREIFQKLIIDNLSLIFNVKETIPAKTGRDLSLFNGIIRSFKTSSTDNNKVIIKSNILTLQDYSSIEKESINTIIFDGCKNLKKYSGKLDLSKFEFITYLEINNCDTTEFTTEGILYYEKYIHSNKLSCLCKNSILRGNEKFKLFQYIISLEIKETKNTQANLNIGTVFRNLKNLLIEINPELAKLKIENQVVEKLCLSEDIRKTYSEIICPIYIRCSNLTMLKFKDKRIENIFIFGSSKLNNLIIQESKIDIPTLQKILEIHPNLKRLEIKNSMLHKSPPDELKIIQITNNIEELILENLDFEIGFQNSNLQNLKHLDISNVHIKLAEDFSSKISGEKLAFLYETLASQKNPIPPELAEKFRAEPLE